MLTQSTFGEFEVELNHFIAEQVQEVITQKAFC